MRRNMKSKGLLVGMLVLGIVCFASKSALADGPLLDGLWLKLNAAVQGYMVDKGTGNIVKQNLTAPLYMGLAWDTDHYNVRLFTETAPGVWTNTYSSTKTTITYNQNFISDFRLTVYVNNDTDYFLTFHTPYIKYVLDNTGAVKKATYSGTGEVYNGSFNADASACYGSVKISGTTVDVSKLPFTP
jgi:hypothetical protein